MSRQVSSQSTRDSIRDEVGDGRIQLRCSSGPRFPLKSSLKGDM